MPIVLGIDGCPQGWCAISLDTSTGTFAAIHHATFATVLATKAEVIAIDVPIGLMEGPGGRDCDREARAFLGHPRASSVFSPPARDALSLCGQKDRYKEACEINARATGKKISQQSFWIGPKIREVDEALRAEPDKRVYEVHPEVSFAVLAGHAMKRRKSTHDGRAECWSELRRLFPQLPLEPAKPPELGRDCDLEDYVDALVCAWTAQRIFDGECDSLPADPPLDRKGMQMAIWRPRR